MTMTIPGVPPLPAPEHSLLVLVDYQQRLLPAIHAGAAVLAQAERLARIARCLGVRVIGTEQNPARLGPNAAGLRELCDLTLPKLHFDACADGLLKQLHTAAAAPARAVVLAGCEAHVCLQQTAFGLLRAGIQVHVVADACGSRLADDRALALQRLQRAGADLLSVEMVAFEWLGSCEHPDFRTVLELVKPLR